MAAVRTDQMRRQARHEATENACHQQYDTDTRRQQSCLGLWPPARVPRSGDLVPPRIALPERLVACRHGPQLGPVGAPSQHSQMSDCKANSRPEMRQRMLTKSLWSFRTARLSLQQTNWPVVCRGRYGRNAQLLAKIAHLAVLGRFVGSAALASRH